MRPLSLDSCANPLCNLLKDQTALPEGSNTRTPHPSRLTQTLLLRGLSPHTPPPLCANDANENEVPPLTCEGRPMPSDGEVDDVLTDWLGSPCCRAFVTAAAAAVGVVQHGRLRGHLVR